MDPITTAIVAALTTAVAKGTGAVGERVLPDAYTALKAALRRKFGEQSDVAKAVDGVEARPDSAGRKQTLAEEMAAAKADQDPDLLKAAQALLEQVEAQPGGERHIQEAIGSYIAQADRASTASVNVGQREPGTPPRPEHG
jgi:hypothetical protein